jgi:hypothetical protein
MRNRCAPRHTSGENAGGNQDDSGKRDRFPEIPGHGATLELFAVPAGLPDRPRLGDLASAEGEVAIRAP